MRGLGRFVIRHRRATIVVWVILAVAALVPAGKLGEEIGNGGYEVPGSPSQRVAQIGEKAFPQTSGQALAVVYRGPQATLVRRGREATTMARRLARRPDVHHVGAVTPAPDERVVIVPFYLALSLAEAQKEADSIRAWVADASGGRARLVGQAAVWNETTAISKHDLSRAERISLPITFLVLIAAFLSVVAAFIPIGLAILALLVTFAALGLLSHVVDMSVYVTNTAELLGLGLAIDYSLFIVSRYRERKGEGATIDEAIEDAVATTGRAVLVSGVTIALGLSSLAVLGVGVFGSMALGASAAAAIAALGALTLVPAILRTLGPRVDGLSIRPAIRAAERGRVWTALGNTILRRRWSVLVLSIVILLVCAVPLLGTRLMFAGTDGLLPSSNELRQTSDAVNRSFGFGVLEPIEVLARAPVAKRVGAALHHDRGVHALPAERGRGGWDRFAAFPKASGGSREGDATVRRVRGLVAGVTPAGTALVGGAPALGIDLIERVEDRLPWMIAMACALAFLLLLVALRSLVVPLKAVLTNLLSVAATIGLVTFIFQDLGGAEGIAWFVPPFLFAIVFGLSMDYEVFLLSRVREEYDTGIGNDAAVTGALRHSGRPITLAAIVIMLVFLTSADTSLESFRQLGVGMAIAVLLDATLVRCGLVPAALAVLGDRNWWLPRRLARLLPGAPGRGARPAPVEVGVEAE
ncbi:MAG TPA: MMPL family transporter [Solirubrobacterales bacterium]|nr:MMPL family transporter [Solirubrobacterales bacterium]